MRPDKINHTLVQRRPVATQTDPTPRAGNHIQDNRAISVQQRKLSTLVKNSQLQQTTQLKVSKYGAGRWYSTYDPYTTLSTKAKATTYDRKLRKKGLDQIKARVPTLYTYTHTKPTNKLSSVPQGPHTFAHRGVLQSLINAKTVLDVYGIFDNQVLDPSDAESVVFTDEAPSSGFKGTMQLRLERYVDDYEDIYDQAVVEFNQKSPNLIKVKHLTNQLLNMDPYAVYAWKTTNKASKKSLSGKRESVTDPTFDDLYDEAPSKSVKNKDARDSFKKARQSLFDDNF